MQTLLLFSKEIILLNKNAITLAALTCLISSGHAATIEQLSKKNSELLELKAELEIAKTKDSLQKIKQANAPVNTSAGNVVRAKPQKASPTADIDGVEFIGAGGDYANPTGKFLIGSAAINRRQGEQINGWQLVKLTANDANFVKTDKGATLHKTIYLSAVNRLNERRSVPATSVAPAATTGQTPFVPAVQPPIR